jgi:hypothetical protein
MLPVRKLLHPALGVRSVVVNDDELSSGLLLFQNACENEVEDGTRAETGSTTKNPSRPRCLASWYLNKTTDAQLRTAAHSCIHQTK